MDFSNEKLVMIALLLDKDEFLNENPRKYWVHSACEKRET